MRYAYRLAPLNTVLIGLLSVLAAGLTVAAPLLVGQTIGRLPEVAAAGVNVTFVVLLTALLVVLPLSNVIQLASEVLVEKLDGFGERDVALRMGYAVSHEPSLTTLDNPVVTSAVQRVRGRKGEVQHGVRITLGSFVGQMLGFTGSAAALGIALTWWVPLLMALAAAVEASYKRHAIRDQMDLWSDQTEPQKHAQYAFEQGMGRAAKEVRIFGLAGFLRQRYRDQITAAYTPYWRRRARQGAVGLVVNSVRVAVTVGALVYTGWLSNRGDLGLTGLSTCLPLIGSIGATDMWMFGIVERGAATINALERLCPGGPLAYLDDPAPPPEPPIVTGAPPSIVFDDVSFTYPGTDHEILSGLSLCLPAGQAVALVGINGAGKSTLVKLMAGTYHPTRGRVLIDGVDLATLDDDALADWQRRIAPITQDFIRVPLPAGDNVEFGTGQMWAGRIGADRWPSTTDLDTVAARAGIGDLINRMPARWATPLDKTIPGGTDLSGGEWQRIGLARALRAVAVGASVLVLDEPAAALDVEAEARLVDGYLDLARRVTSLVISHRFSVVRPVPTICVLEHGRIIEQGSHAELMTACGRYYTMFSLQASRYVGAGIADEAGAR
jgi:ATP-binding cassette subfamily B protein